MENAKVLKYEIYGKFYDIWGGAGNPVVFCVSAIRHRSAPQQEFLKQKYSPPDIIAFLGISRGVNASVEGTC
jgi:hypothetical protein